MERWTLQSPGAFRLPSNVPVTVYQFSPLEYQLDEDCDAEHDPDVPEPQNPSSTASASRTATTPRCCCRPTC